MNNWCINTALDYSTLPVLIQIDVLVVGGGSAGVAAATVSGEKGYSTLLLEKYGFCGGAAVAGMSATICGIYLTRPTETMDKCKPKQIVFGFTERFRQGLKNNNGLTEPQRYGNTFVDAHEARVWKKTADNFLANANVKVLYHTSVIDVIKEDNVVTGVVVSSGSGLGIIKAKRIIDSSGDGVVAAMAGEGFTCGLNGIVQNPTMIFKLSGIDNDKFWDYFGKDTICHDEFSDKLISSEKKDGFDLPRKKIWVFRSVNDSEVFINATAINHTTEKLNVINPEHFTYSEIKARKQIIDYYAFFKKYIPGCTGSFIGEQGCEVGIRQTRSMKCKYTLKNTDVEDCRKFDDGIVKSSWPIELHKGGYPKLYWLYDKYYEVPFRTLVPDSVENIILAGRCLSAEHEALASARVTAQCFEYGRAAAIGVDLSIKQNCRISQVDGTEVRKLMEGNE